MKLKEINIIRIQASQGCLTSSPDVSRGSIYSKNLFGLLIELQTKFCGKYDLLTMSFESLSDHPFTVTGSIDIGRVD